MDQRTAAKQYALPFAKGGIIKLNLKRLFKVKIEREIAPDCGLIPEIVGVEDESQLNEQSSVQAVGISLMKSLT
jgi:hypothetical protein